MITYFVVVLPIYVYSDVDPEVAQSLKMWRKSIMLVWQHASQHKYVQHHHM